MHHQSLVWIVFRRIPLILQNEVLHFLISYIPSFLLRHCYCPRMLRYYRKLFHHHHHHSRQHSNEYTHQRSGKHILSLFSILLTESDHRLRRYQEPQCLIMLHKHKSQDQPTLNITNQSSSVNSSKSLIAVLTSPHCALVDLVFTDD